MWYSSDLEVHFHIYMPIYPEFLSLVWVKLQKHWVQTTFKVLGT